MVQVHDGGGPGRPQLPAQAGTHEQTLYELYDFQTGIVSYTASQWRTTASEVTELAASVRRVVRELRNAPDGGEAWSGDAAEAAYATLGRLATNLDTHAEEIARIESGLTLAGDAVVEARTAYVTSVRTVSLDVDEQAYTRTPFMRPGGPAGPDLPATLDQAAYDAAVADARARREAEALTVLQSFDGSMTEATKKLPVEPDYDPVSSGGTGGSGGGGGGYPAGGGSSGGGDVGPGGGGTVPPGPGWLPPTDGGPDGPGPTDPNPTDPGPTDPGPTDTGPTDTTLPPDGGGPSPVLDGPTTGTTGPGSGSGGVAPLPGSTGAPGATGGGGLGAGGAAAGMGGMLAGGGAAALMGRSGGPGGPGAGRPGVVVGGSTAAGRPGGTTGSGRPGTGAVGRTTVLPGGGQGAARAGSGRGASRGTGASGGTGRTGRYGVPRLGDRDGRSGAAGATGAAGAGGRGGTRDEDGQDVDRLTTEDEETWFEGAEDATPPVWE